MCLQSFIDVGIRIAFESKLKLVRNTLEICIFGRAILALGYSIFLFGWKGHIFKYLSPKKGSGLARNDGDTATERKQIPRTLEGTIYFSHIHWSIKFSIALCNYKIKIL